MKILFVCQQYIHAARWIGQLKDSGHDIYVFDCLDTPIHDDLKWTNYFTGWRKRKVRRLKGEDWLKKYVPKIFYFIEPFLKVTASEKLTQIIADLNPDVVHSFEMQSQTYPLLKVIKKSKSFKWIYSCWGSDLYLYQNDKIHLSKIKKVLNNLDYAFFDCHRDEKLAQTLGFKGKSLGVFPGGGGYHLEEMTPVIKPLSERNLILIKGYHHWAGRALKVLNAIEIIKDSLKGYEIYVYSAHQIVVDKINKINTESNLNIQYSTRANELAHQDLLAKFGQAKIAIGNSISDGIPNTLLEAIIMGAFPIQSNPGGASDDYIKDGENGLLIQNPEDEKEIASKILRALQDKDLVQKAYLGNAKIAQSLDYNIIQTRVLKAYNKMETDL